MATLNQWVEGARPRTLPAAIAPVLVGTGAAYAMEKANPGYALLALIVALFLQIGVNYANDYSDGIRGTDDDRVGHRPGGHPTSDAADGRGAVLTGDTIKGVMQPGMVTFMRSYPNMIPLSRRLVRQIVDRVNELRFDRLYDAFGVVVAENARDVVDSSARRYIGWVTDSIVDPDDPHAPARGPAGSSQASG